MTNFNELTVNENVLLHLGDYSQFTDHYVVPFSTTQDGISEAVGVARPHVSRAIKELKNNGLVLEKKARVEKVERKRTVYFLTSEGAREIKRLRDYLTYYKKMTSYLPMTPNIIGRKKELTKLKTWEQSKSKLIIVEGVSGIGKTSLVSKFATGSKKHKFLFWHSVKKADTMRDVLNALGDILYVKNNNLLRYYLLSNFDINEDKIIKILAKSLSKALIVLDNCENMSKDLARFISKLVNTIEDVRIILISEDETRLPPGLSFEGSVSKLTLAGLEKGETQQLLKGGDHSDKIYNMTSGHPLFIKLIGPDFELHGDIKTCLKKYIDTNLSKEEKKLMEVASVHQLPFKAKGLFVEAGVDYEVMTRLKNKSLLTEISNGVYVVHEFIKDHFYDSLTKSRKRNLHIRTADYYLEAEDSTDIIEAIHHYVAADKYDKASETAISHGISLIEKGHFTEFEKALGEIEEKKVSDLKKAEILILKGHLQKVKGNWENAIHYYRDSLKIYETHELVEKVADVNRLIGAIHKDRGDYDDALEIFNHALKLIEGIENEVTAKIYDDIGTVKLRMQEVNEAEKVILQGLKIAEKIGDEKQTAINNLTLGNLYLARGEWDKAKRTYKGSADVFDRVQNLRMLAVCYNNLAITYFRTSEMKKAFDYWKKSLSISEKIGDIKVMFSYVNLGFITFKKGEWTQTEEYCKKALTISENIDNATISSAAYSILGHIYVNRRNLTVGIGYYEKALKLREKEGDESKILSSQNDLSHAYLIDGHTKKAKKFAEMAFDMASNAENKEECARAHLNLGNCLIQMQRSKEAKDRLGSALRYSNQIKNRSLTGKIYLNIGELYIKEKEYLAAERHLTDCVHIFEELEEQYELALGLVHLARSYKESGTEEPTEYFERGKAILHSLNAEKALDLSF